MAEVLSLGYMPLRFRKYEPAWLTALIVSCGLALIALLNCTTVMGAGPLNAEAIAVCAASVLLLAFLPAAVTVVLWWFDIAVECRIEGQTLYVRSYTRWEPAQIDIQALRQIAVVREPRRTWCELVFQDGRRIRFDGGPLLSLILPGPKQLKRHQEFVKAVHEVNPAVAFIIRDGRICEACGNTLWKPATATLASQCSTCGTLIPPWEMA